MILWCWQTVRRSTVNSFKLCKYPEVRQMQQTRLKNQKSIKIVSEDEAVAVPGGVITSEQTALPSNCYIVPMVVLDKPIPLPKTKKKKS